MMAHKSNNRYKGADIPLCASKSAVAIASVPGNMPVIAGLGAEMQSATAAAPGQCARQHSAQGERRRSRPFLGASVHRRRPTAATRAIPTEVERVPLHFVGELVRGRIHRRRWHLHDPSPARHHPSARTSPSINHSPPQDRRQPRPLAAPCRNARGSSTHCAVSPARRPRHRDNRPPFGRRCDTMPGRVRGSSPRTQPAITPPVASPVSLFRVGSRWPKPRCIVSHRQLPTMISARPPNYSRRRKIVRRKICRRSSRGGHTNAEPADENCRNLKRYKRLTTFRACLFLVDPVNPFVGVLPLPVAQFFSSLGVRCTGPVI